MSINKVILVGHVGKDPEVRYFDNNLAMARFAVATTERGYTTRSGQVIPDKTEWHNVVVWRKLAEVVEKYVKKGTHLYIEGKLRNRSYDDKDGVKRYTTEIQVDTFQFLGKRSEGDSSAPERVSNSAHAIPTARVQEQPMRPTTPAYNPQFQPPTMTNVPPPMPGDADFPPHSESFLAMDDMDDLPF